MRRCSCTLDQALSPFWCCTEKFGTGLALVRTDINGNISRLATAQSKDPSRYEALYPIILDEVQQGQPSSSSSNTNGLLWLKRCCSAAAATVAP